MIQSRLLACCLDGQLLMCQDLIAIAEAMVIMLPFSTAKFCCRKVDLEKVEIASKKSPGEKFTFLQLYNHGCRIASLSDCRHEYCIFSYDPV